MTEPTKPRCSWNCVIFRVLCLLRLDLTVTHTTMKLLVLLACVAAATCTTVDRCAWGPSYWCSDVRVAKECGAMQHCMDTVWKKQRLDTVESSETCVICQLVVSKIKEEMQAIPKTEITAMVAKMCAVLPDAERATCKQLVNSYMPEIFQLLTNDLDPKVVCAALTLCAGFEDRLHHAAKEAARSLVPKVHGDLECSLCKQAVAELKQLVEDQATQTAIENFLEQNVCPLLGAENATCIEYIKMYAPVVFEIASNELDPDTVCMALQLCVNQTKAAPAPPSPAHLIRVSLKKAPLHVVTFKPAAPKKQVQDGPLCPLCEFVMKEVDQMLEQNKSEQAIIAALDKVCSILPSTIKDECISFVNQYAPAIIDLLVQEVDPKQVCTQLGLCTATATATATGKKAVPLHKVKDVECDLCQELINYFNEFLNENSSVAEIEAVLDQVCNLLPSTLKDQCNSLVSEYGPVLVQLLRELDDPLQVCQAIHLCTSTKIFVSPKDTLPLLGSKECTWGPTYWCASQENAAKCGAVDHCKKHVWN